MNGIYGMAATGLHNDSSFAANEAVREDRGQGRRAHRDDPERLRPQGRGPTRPACADPGLQVQHRPRHRFRQTRPWSWTRRSGSPASTGPWPAGTAAAPNGSGTQRKTSATSKPPSSRTCRGTGATVTAPHLIIWPSSAAAKDFLLAAARTGIIPAAARWRAPGLRQTLHHTGPGGSGHHRQARRTLCQEDPADRGTARRLRTRQ